MFTALAVTAGRALQDSPRIVVHRLKESPRGPLAHPGEGSPSSQPIHYDRSRGLKVHAVKA